MAPKLSAAIITLNEARKLPDCLASLDFVDEIGIVDSGSTDQTKQIAISQGALFKEKKFENFADQKNAAMDFVNGEWVLFIDADERITQELKNSILKVIGEKDANAAYRLTRVNQIFGGVMRHGASGVDQPIRLIKKGAARYEGLVHEQLKVTGSTGLLSGELFHQTYQTLDEYYSKFNLFSSLDAEEMLKRKAGKPSMLVMLLRPWIEFVLYYFIKLGFLDGWRGFLYQVLSSYYTFIKFAKARELYDVRNK